MFGFGVYPESNKPQSWADGRGASAVASGEPAQLSQRSAKLRRRPLAHRHLLERVREMEYVEEARYLKAFVRRLRRKPGGDPGCPSRSAPSEASDTASPLTTRLLTAADCKGSLCLPMFTDLLINVYRQVDACLVSFGPRVPAVAAWSE